MKLRMVVLALMLLPLAAVAGDGYTVVNSQNIMHFVAIDEDRELDKDTYRRAVDEICKDAKKCQVLFWTGTAPATFPMSREQVRAQTAYWQYSEKKGKSHLYVNCDLFPDVEEADCL